MGIDTGKLTLWGGGAPQLGDLHLLEDGGERGGTLVSDMVVPQTVSEEQSGDGEEAGVSMGVDKKANTIGPGGLPERLQRGVALEALGESGSSFRAESVFRETASMGAETGVEGCQWALTETRTLRLSSSPKQPTRALAASSCPEGPQQERLLSRGRGDCP